MTHQESDSPPSAYLQALQARLLRGDPTATHAIEQIALFSNLEELVEEAGRAGALHEHRFASALPLIGPVVAAVRSALYTLTARWPLWVVIAQQNQFNRTVARALAESLALNRRLLQRIDQLEARVAQLERERHR
ncbi:MAG: hypothetical protein RMN25_06820 [Anaerolineae bacterium]|nr:hypothetical protein [Thermoflexales bacterium]MDW8407483.1 hypothetical protein [Anaerolineae bacterium]